MEIRINGYVLTAVAVLATIVLWFLLLPGLWPVSAILHSIYTDPLSWVVFAIFIITSLIALGSEGNYTTGTIAVVSFIAWIIWAVILYNPTMMVGLREATNYQKTAELIPLTEVRETAYATAQKNIESTNPKAQFKAGDLDYVREAWVAEYGPNKDIDFFNKLRYPTQGFIAFKNGANEPYVEEEMPFAENGYLANSANFWLKGKGDPFIEPSDILFIKDPDNNGYMGVVPIIKRSGWRRVPYVAYVDIIHGNSYGRNQHERLSPRQAEKDPRLTGVQLIPEALERMTVEAYGWQNGVLSGIFFRTGRVEVQKSDVNQENSAPYHLKSEKGLMWYTPYAPLGNPSMKGIMMQDSTKINSPILIWELPGNQTYKGVDFMATTIKGANGHPLNLTWMRVSKTGDGTVRAGDTEIRELVPTPRREGNKVVLYLVGYATTDPPTKTRFYVIVNAATEEVFQDQYSVEAVNRWLQGKSQIAVQTKPSQETNIQPSGSSTDVTKMTNDQLRKLIDDATRQINTAADELKRRAGNFIAGFFRK